MYNRSTSIVVYLLSVSHVPYMQIANQDFKSVNSNIRLASAICTMANLFLWYTAVYLAAIFFRTQKFADAFAFYYLHKARDGTGLFSHSYLIEISFVKSCRN